MDMLSQRQPKARFVWVLREGLNTYRLAVASAPPSERLGAAIGHIGRRLWHVLEREGWRGLRMCILTSCPVLRVFRRIAFRPWTRCGSRNWASFRRPARYGAKTQVVLCPVNVICRWSIAPGRDYGWSRAPDARRERSRRVANRLISEWSRRRT